MPLVICSLRVLVCIVGLGQGERTQNLNLGGQQSALQALLQGQHQLSQYRKAAVPQPAQVPNYASAGFNYSQVGTPSDP